MAKITAQDILRSKGKKKIAALTAYDHPTALLMDQAEIPIILVGDSLGMVVLGYPDTTHVTMADMIHHVAAVARAHPKGIIVADLPYHSYSTPDEALMNSRRLLAAGANAVKAEGGRAILPQIQAIIADHIPFLGHLGMLPQSIHEEGSYKIKGKVEAEHQALRQDLNALCQAGAFGVVLELVTRTVASELTRDFPIPTIGIGSGPECDGQILVTTDLLGTSPGFIPKHVHGRAHLRESMLETLISWKNQVESAAHS